MALITEGRVAFNVPGLDKSCETYYKIAGDFKCGKPALLALHGGPGLIHDYLMPLAALYDRAGIPVIFYDQISNGKSSHIREREGNMDFWQEQLFRAELENLIKKLDLCSTGKELHQLGRYAGSSFATYRPVGLRKLIISNAPAVMAEWIRSEIACCKALPQDVADSLFECDRNGDYQNPKWKAGKALYGKTYQCRSKVFPPPELVSTFQALADDRTVNGTMYGKTLILSDSLKTWTVVDRLHLIDRPTLVINGEFDIVDQGCVKPFFDNIPKVKWMTLKDKSHLPLLEDTKTYLQLVAQFLE
ncbi:proline-specific peptidase [Myriangium duriaei CBS 260.36]|uniref:Proline-specific peptidase n=1 Tax=Myriangium duriaei CBS 260.36 TaxID=1168546 RepID=A0A9P4MCD7_9PEZI|nr:proline-specific peptidase [Myriangium duriaei CBS 260.36]